MLLGSEGILGVITEAWVRVQERPRYKLSCGVAFDSFASGAEAVRELAQSGLHPANCRLLDAAESALTHAGPPGKALLVLGFESAHHPVDAAMDVALDAVRGHGGEAGEVRGRRDAPEKRSPGSRSAARQPPTEGGRGRSRGRVAPRLPGRAVPARHVRRLRGAERHLRDGDHVGSVRGLSRRGDGDRAPSDRRRLRHGAGRAGVAPALVSLHARLSRRPCSVLHRVVPGPPRWRGGAVGRDQGGRLGRGDRRWRNDHPSSRRRP